MTDLQLKLSKEQFKTILELVYLGNMMVNGHRNEPIKEYVEIEKLFFTLAPQYGIENCSDEESPQYPSRFFEEGEMQIIIDEYDDTTFWEELIDRLTEMMRDRDYTMEQLSSMDPMERFKLFFLDEDKVRAYISEYGLTHFPLPKQ